MSQMLGFSEAAAIAMHTVLLLAINKDSILTTKGMSATLGISENHCAKVMQRLVKAGIVRATRGPGGGFSLAQEPGKLTLLDVYEVIEGKLQERHCLFMVEKCPAQQCMFHQMTGQVNRLVRDYLQNTTFATMIAKGNFN